MPGVNDFTLKIGTVNGTGSASANGLLMQAIFRMGIPVVGKNVFPSNIQGLPTWYEIRVNKDGYTARNAPFDLMVAMNTGTYKRDVAEIAKGGWLLYDSSWPLPKALHRDDITVLGVPLGEMCVETFGGDRERTLMKNIAYTGALVGLIDIDMDVVMGMLHEKFSKKKHLLDSNDKALRLGYDYVKKHFKCPLPIRLEKMDKTGDHILIDGNAAAALGCVYAGATVGAWYPITPATSLMENFNAYCQQFRVDKETKKKNFCIVQAEDELAAAGIVVGAGWMGARAFTPTAGPGISLMSEFVGLAYYAEVPAVFFDVQRTGPSTGMPTRTQQADILSIAHLSHGDTKHLMLFPANPEECFYLAADSFDIAERFQTPVFVLSDLDIGMNDWMCRRLKWDDARKPDRGKVLSAPDLEKIEKFYRYNATNGDGIAARTLPGVHPKGSYFTRGSGHNKLGGYTEDSDEYREVVDRIARKIDAAAESLPAPEIITHKGNTVGVITIGSARGAVMEALDRLRDDGLSLDYLRVRAFPFSKAVHDFVASHEKCIVIEMNRDAQLRSLLILETGVHGDRLESLLEYGGLPFGTGQIIAGIRGILEGVKA
ncbi:MAG TPA: 2-oxoacid:acceptor oxidoreductase subunit alpha [Gemmatimonadaceae bacterium]|nr:2-oxoacid:acceptor oxidoreductase subunit alpha [Gemmatimonadaceae bacterium]